MRKNERPILETVDEMLKNYDKTFFIIVMAAIKDNHEKFMAHFRKRLEEVEKEPKI